MTADSAVIRSDAGASGTCLLLHGRPDSAGCESVSDGTVGCDTGAEHGGG